MAAPDKSPLFSRLHELRAQQGKGWKEIANILEEEGYEENGKALTENALRKRYSRWNKTDARGTSLVASEPDPKQEGGELDLDCLQRTPMESSLKQLEGGAALPAVPENAIVSGIASLVTLNNRVLEQIQESNRLMKRLERRIEDQESKTSHIEHTDEQPVTSRDLLELLNEFGRGQQMKFIDENKEYLVSRQEVQQLIEESVQDRIDAELKIMLSEGGSFSKELAHLIDHRMKNLLAGAEPVTQTAQAGPGRGKRGKTHKKFSASLEENLFNRVKSLPGQFSAHLARALEGYLSVAENKEKCD